MIVVPAGAAPIHASVSSAGSVVLVALATVPVGVDVERDSATRFAGFAGAASWARKEAILKLAGLGAGEQHTEDGGAPRTPSAAARNAPSVLTSVKLAVG